MGLIKYNDISYGGGGGGDNSIVLTQAQYDALPQSEKEDISKIYYISDAQITPGGAVIDDNDIAPDKLWSSQKTSTEIAQAGGAVIDDTTTATTKVWSSQKTSSELANKVDSVSGKGLSTEDYTTAEKTKLTNIESGAEVNTIESISVNGTAITPDINKNVDIETLTKAVNDLQNYYLKTETYTKAEVDNIAAAIKNSRFEVVASLPVTDIKTNVIYLVPSQDPQASNVKDEYINLDGTTSGWEKIGSTDVDLSDYVTTSDMNTALASKVDTSQLGVTGGVATLDSNGKIPSSQISSLSASEITALEALTND